VSLDKISITHINTRLWRGGAARVSHDIAEAQRALGHRVQEVYGFGKLGRRDNFETIDSVRTVSSVGAIANYLTYPFLGYDLFGRPNFETNTFGDFLHLHNLHSGFLNLKDFANFLIGRKYVLTLHDYWFLTGRCAIPMACDRWEKNSCYPCANLESYRPSKIQPPLHVFESEVAIKRQIFENATQVTSPSLHLANNAESFFQKNVMYIPNPVNDSFFAEGKSSDSDKVSRALVIVEDFCQTGKVDWEVIENFISTQVVPLTFVGRNLPDEYSNNEHFDSLSSTEVAKLMRTSSSLLFTSSIDNSSVVLLEALVSGLPIIALESPNASEVLADFGIAVWSREDLMSPTIEPLSHYSTSVHEVQSLAKKRFSSRNVASKFLEIASCP
jgi:putative colanic acid biosynthesis glycosyltransferase